MRNERLIVGFEGTQIPSELSSFCARGGPPLGVVLFGRNIEGPAQLRALVAELRTLWPREGPTPLVCVDQEGGLVQRLKPPAIPDVAAVPPMREAAAARDAAGLRALGAAMGRDLARYGFNVDFAPVLDVDTNPDNPIIGARAFGATADEVIARALPFAAGLGDAGVMPCGKHFPGHGDTDLDSHLALPRLRHDEARLAATELAPFRAAVDAGIPLLMTAHIVYEALDSALPATLSPHIVPRLLRRNMGYDGVVVTDDLEMRAMADHWDADDLARGVLAADVDVMLVCRDLVLATEVSEALARHETPEQAERADRRLARLRAEAYDHAATLLAST